MLVFGGVGPGGGVGCWQVGVLWDAGVCGGLWLRVQD